MGTSAHQHPLMETRKHKTFWQVASLFSRNTLNGHENKVKEVM